MVYTFHKYASQEGERLIHNKGAMKELLRKKLPSYVGDNVDGEKVKKVMDDLDKDRDQQADFREYTLVLVVCAILFNNSLEGSPALQSLPRISWLKQLSIFVKFVPNKPLLVCLCRILERLSDALFLDWVS
ncbi:protein S100-A2-like [Mus pahari]|uniref:protein S100-A2-like n=1 Tax=Mus pahari TaxID=10093 RepID=UPI000A305167|nr:protein S100-A2-like [Mus pahari]